MTITSARKFFIGIAFFLVWGMAASSSAAIITFDLLNHPDGNQNPPPYGLRIDALEFFLNGPEEGSVNDVWTFSFDDPDASMTGTYDDVANTFLIEGTAVGGVDTGGSGGSAEVAISFLYEDVTNLGLLSSFPVLEVTTGAGGSGSGTLTFNEAAESIPVFTVVNLVAFANSSGLFMRFAADNHRLDCGSDAGCGNPVFRGWLGLVPSPSVAALTDPEVFHVSSQDWLLTSDVNGDIPEPGTLALFGLGGLALVLRRRRS